jgi:hypothetical protein
MVSKKIDNDKRCQLERLDETLKKEGRTKTIGGEKFKFILGLKRRDTSLDLRKNLKSLGIKSKIRKDAHSGLECVWGNNKDICRYCSIDKNGRNK